MREEEYEHGESAWQEDAIRRHRNWIGEYDTNEKRFLYLVQQEGLEVRRDSGCWYVEVDWTADDVVDFLRKLKKGGCDASWGRSKEGYYIHCERER
jgi:hypothetical protein